ncbi:MAG: type I DNA topoisomerase [Candidatus Pacebacteria bacterium]|nr:type I DNA topoisomerase [Candidatus Paceibacterota bacterium]
MSTPTKKLIIVESPTKAKTISRFLGKEYIVESSFGHLRDLPKKKMGIDIENDFQPEYEVNEKSKKRANELKRLAKKADEIILASDEDREGEAIAWHLMQILGIKTKEVLEAGLPIGSPASKTFAKNYKRIVFHEITKNAILEALKNPRDLDMNLVDAQQARRILDRLVGYELSPFLWKKIRYGLSAGRVQSVAVRLIVEREEEIRKFKADEYWSVKSVVAKEAGLPTVGSPASDITKFEIRLIKINNKAVPKLGIKSKKEADEIKDNLEKADYQVEKVTKKETKKNPLPPFTTSTLQQAANNKLHFSAKQTMMLAQKLYEGTSLGSKGTTGLITYMRTDSLSLSKSSLESAEKYITNKFGKEYFNQRFFKTRSKGAQEAHEAIRPTDPERDPESVKNYLDDRQYKLYKLIWQRMVASQMASAISDLTTIDVLATVVETRLIASLRATGSVIKFEGFLKVYSLKSEEIILPKVEEKENLDLLKVITEQHFTQPPARYTEASLVKKLEEEGIGRPSTYAPTLSTIQDRGYVEKIERKFHPKDIGELVNKLLVEHFPNIVDLKFTANMEKDFDEIAAGKIKWVPVIKAFYKPFKTNLMQKEKEVNKKDLTEEATSEKCEKCGSPMIIKMGRFGKFMACNNYPDCKNTKQINEKGEIEEPETTNEVCEKCGKPMVFKQGRYGKFLGCSGYPDCKNIKAIVKSTGIHCPKCEKGEIVEKKSKKGKTFFACNQYPKCEYAMWNKPTGEKCPVCGELMSFGKGDKGVCGNKECGKK